MAWQIEKDVLYPGRVVVAGPSGKPLEYTFTPRDLALMNRTGNLKIADHWNVPLVFEHQDEKPDRRKMVQLSHSEREREFARGVFGCAKGYRLDGNRLKAILAGDDDEDLKRFQKIKFVSPEIEWDWMDSDGKVWHGPTITHIAATPRPVQRHQEAVRLSQNANKPRQFADLGEFIESAGSGRNVGGTIHPFVIRLSLNDYAEAPMADDENGASGGGKKGNWCSRIVAALAGVGIKLPDCNESKDPEHFADLIETACLNADQGPSDDELLEPEAEENMPEEPPGDMEQPPPGAEAPPGPPIQMSLTRQTERAAELARRNLAAEIKDLERTRRITPAVADDLRNKLKAVRLSFAKSGDLQDNAVSVRIEAFQQNPPGSAFSTKAAPSDKAPAGRWVMRGGKRVRLSIKTPHRPAHALDTPQENKEEVSATIDLWNKTGAKA